VFYNQNKESNKRALGFFKKIVYSPDKLLERKLKIKK